MDNSRSTVFKFKRNIHQIPHCPTNSILAIRLHIEYKESTATSTEQFSTQCAGSHAFCVQIINAISRNSRTGLTLQSPCVIKHPTKIIEVIVLVRQNTLRIINERKHFLKLSSLILLTYSVCFLHIGRETSKARKEHHQILIKLLFAFCRNDNRQYFVAICIEVDAVETAKGSRNLILPATGLLTQVSLKVNCFVRQLFLVRIFAFECVKCIQHSNSEGTGCSPNQNEPEDRLHM